eukprot:4320858-Prymnesium_polylepis.1
MVGVGLRARLWSSSATPVCKHAGLGDCEHLLAVQMGKPRAEANWHLDLRTNRCPAGRSSDKAYGPFEFVSAPF